MASWKRVITTDDDSSYKNSNLTASNIPADSITGAKIADDSIGSEHYVAGSVDRFAIGTAQVREDQLSTDAVATAKIADSAVTAAKIAADAISGAKIANDAIDSEHYVDGSIDTAHIANDAVTFAKMQHTTSNNRVLGASTAGAISQVQVNGSMIASDAISHGNIADGAIRPPALGADVINGNTAETSIADADEILIYDVSASANRKMTKANFVAGLGTDTNLTQEEVEDFAGALVATGGTKTGIAVTYDDANGNMDFVVSSQTDNNFTTALKNKLDAIEASADVTDATNVTAAGALMDSEISSLASVKAINQSLISGASPTFSTTNMTDATDKRFMSNAQESKLDGIEASADVTDKINVTAALNSNLGNVTIGDSNDTITIAGNLTVSGTTTTINTETVNIQDNIIVLNSNSASTPVEDAGIAVERGSRTNVFINWDESAAEWTSRIQASSANDTTGYTGRVAVIERAASGTSGSVNTVGGMFINSGTGAVYIYS